MGSEEWLKISEEMTDSIANLAALLEGQVSQLKGNGWTDREARQIILKMVLGQ